MDLEIEIKKLTSQVESLQRRVTKLEGKDKIPFSGTVTILGGKDES